MADALWKLEAGETAAKIAAKEISAGDVIEAHLARLDAVNPARFLVRELKRRR